MLGGISHQLNMENNMDNGYTWIFPKSGKVAHLPVGLGCINPARDGEDRIAENAERASRLRRCELCTEKVLR